MRRVALVVTLAAALVVPVTTSADAAVRPKVYQNCAALQKDYPHGVARAKGVKDKVRGRTKPVTTYVVNRTVYDLNKKKLDADKDLIVCEKR